MLGIATCPPAPAATPGSPVMPAKIKAPRRRMAGLYPRTHGRSTKARLQICAGHLLDVLGPWGDARRHMSLAGRAAIVTGGNSGIGRAIALALGKRGAMVAINYIVNPEATAELETQINASGGRAIGLKADVSRVAELQGLVDAAVSAFGRLDIMVNNAGVETRTSLLDTTEQQYDRVLDINLKSAFFGSQIAARQMIKQGGGGRIINITSVHEDWPMPGNIAYCLSKGGMRMLTRTGGVELARHNICIVGVGPGAVATPINTSTLENPELLKKLRDAIPMGRMAKPEEIASVVAFLADSGASYMTATTVFADGGLMQ